MKIRIAWNGFAAAVAVGLCAGVVTTGCTQTSSAMKGAAETTTSAAEGAMSAAQSGMSSAGEMAKEMVGDAYYAEEMKDGRIIVFGSQEAHQAFKDAGRVPEIRRTLIGGGPNGETVYIEADKKGDMADRLHMAFKAKHNL